MTPYHLGKGIKLPTLALQYLMRKKRCRGLLLIHHIFLLRLHCLELERDKWFKFKLTVYVYIFFTLFFQNLLLVFLLQVFEITGLISREYFKGYNSLSKPIKIEWNNRWVFFFCTLFIVMIYFMWRIVWITFMQGIFNSPCYPCGSRFFLPASVIRTL